MSNSEDFILASSVFLILFFLSFLLSKLKVPHVLSFMLAGFVGRFFFPWKMEEVLTIFEYLAITLLFFFIGLSYSFERLAGMTKIVVPGLLGFVLNFFPPLLLSYLFTKDLLFSFVMGAVIYPTSTAITAKLLIDYRRLINPEAEFLVGLLIFEDLISIVLLSILVGMASEGQVDIFSFLRGMLAVLLLFSLFYLLRNVSKKAFYYLDKNVDEELIPFLVLGFLILSSGFSLKLGISDALVAFMLGVMVPEESRTFKTIEKYLLGLKELSLGVFFFMLTFRAKLSFDFSWWLFTALLLLSILLKLLSTYWGAILYGLEKRIALRSSLSFLQRGEFSVIFASFYESTQSIVFLLVILTAFLGSFSFVVAPKMSQLIFTKK